MSKPNTDVIVRTVALAVTWANLALVQAGWEVLPWSEEAIGTGVSGVLAFGVSVWTYWKNNSVTDEAKFADEVLDDLKTDK